VKVGLVKLESLSGEGASIYSVIIEGETETLLDKFIRTNRSTHSEEVKEIINRLRLIGHKFGCREQWFKTGEGNPGDGVCALYDEKKKLRLYCIRNSNFNLILGDGGLKSVRKLQEDPKLKKENFFLRDISKAFIKAVKDGDIRYSSDGILIGNLELELR
jgi:hypothetical protein